MPSFAADSDADLLAYMAMERDDPGNAREAYAEFYRRHVRWLYSVVKRVPFGGAEDVVQNAFAAAYRGATSYKPKNDGDATAARRQVRAWLGTIASNEIKRYRKGRGILAVADSTDVETVPAPDSATLLEPELVRRARTLIEELPEREQDVLLSWLDEYKLGSTNQRMSNATSKALADRWQTSTDNIRQIRKRLFDRFRASLQSEQVAMENRK